MPPPGMSPPERPPPPRRSAEPLRASWRPNTGEQPAAPPPQKAKSLPRRIIGTYGWRIYALPILLVLTVIVVFDLSGGSPADEGVRAGATVPQEPEVGGRAMEPPIVTENPVDPIQLDIPTAKLPKGGGFTKSGKGTWHVIPGKSKRVGSGGRLYKYVIEVEDGINPGSYGGDQAFAKTVEATLSDPRSWTFDGTVSFQRINDPAAADFAVSLTTPETNHGPDVCGYTIKFEASCWRSDIGKVVINLARWVRGAKAFNGDLGLYRQYAINHEVGHALGIGHVGCAKDGALAPVMMQQTFGVSNDYVAKLNRTDHASVPRDGKVCKPNAWPNPQP
ncbi:DUF3152 domain-containing protein [Haloechinothrix halophila]|uniref:DUF3152 domain-containing protein n=1 Tax=Haloechinothrix halophila TaxID=1069073 RepID=UPI00040E06C4|nr:DUF3152 domain-containing protein [Haloechinothrix halophila]